MVRGGGGRCRIEWFGWEKKDDKEVNNADGRDGDDGNDEEILESGDTEDSVKNLITEGDVINSSAMTW